MPIVGALPASALVLALLAADQATPPQQTPPPAGAAQVATAGDLTVTGITFVRRDVVEMRARARLEIDARKGTSLRAFLDATVEGLVADRGGRVNDGVVRARDAWVELTGRHLELRAGFGRLAWGRLDEIQPTDVINPIDAAKFFLEGRGEARVPVAFVRGRVIASDRFSVEGVLAPVFRRGSFDEMDEPTSPFNLVNDAVLPAGVILVETTGDRVDHFEPSASWSNVSGGARVSTTAGRVDLAAVVYRGFDGFGTVTFEPDFAIAPSPLVVGHLVERFPRFTMVGGDFESVTGEWAWRGEAAVFTEKTFAGVTVPGPVNGHAVDAGAGFDRPVRGWQVFGSTVIHRQWSGDDPGIARTDVTLVGSIDRRFARERWRVRGFGVVNPGSASGFIRGVLVWQLRDALAVEASAGAFLGTGEDTVSRFSGRDFVFGRVRAGW